MKTYLGTATNAVVKAASQGLATSRGIAWRMRRAVQDVSPRLTYLVATGRLIVIGELHQAKAGGIAVFTGEGGESKFSRRDAMVFAMPGTPMLPPAPERLSVRKAGDLARRERKAKVTGLTAGRITIGRGSFWGAGLV